MAAYAEMSVLQVLRAAKGRPLRPEQIIAVVARTTGVPMTIGTFRVVIHRLRQQGYAVESGPTAVDGCNRREYWLPHDEGKA